MPSIEEIRAGIQKKRIEREETVKRILADVKKKREAIKSYKKQFRKSVSPKND